VIYTLKDILTTISNGENQTVEFKTSFQKEVIESVVAFANSYGGRVFIGHYRTVWFRHKTYKR